MYYPKVPFSVSLFRNTTKVISADQPVFPGLTYGFCSTFHIQLQEKAGNMFFYRVLRHKQGIGYLLVTQSLADKLQNFIFSLADIELLQFFLISFKMLITDINLLFYDLLFFNNNLLFHDFILLKLSGKKNADEQENDTESSDPDL